MYGQTQPLDSSDDHFDSGAKEEGPPTAAGGFIDPLEHISFEDIGGVSCLEGVEVTIPTDAVYVDAAAAADVSDQLTLSFGGQVYVFDAVSAEKVQRVLYLLGGCEFPSNPQSNELVASQSQNQRDTMDYPVRSSDPHRAASLNRFRQKRKERCFDKKIRYNVRQEVAFRMQRKRGQFTSKSSDESTNWKTTENSGQDENPSESSCSHCGTNSKSTPMMRRGPTGPRTLCNACGLFWANRGSLRDISRNLQDNSLITQTPPVEESDAGTFINKQELL
jgi:hypothetical protein